MHHSIQEMEFSRDNSWLQLLLPEHRPVQKPVKNNERPSRVIYTENHPLVVQARQLYQRHHYSYNQMARMINVDPKTISRWAKKGLLQ